MTSTEPLDRIIGRRLTELRTGAGLSLRATAEQMGVYPNALASWEIGESRISASKLFVFCETVKCVVADIYVPLKDSGQSDEPLRAEHSDLRERALPYDGFNSIDAASCGEESEGVIPFPLASRRKPQS